MGSWVLGINDLFFIFAYFTGFHVFPTFVLNEFPLVLTLTLGVVSVKVRLHGYHLSLRNVRCARIAY